ncbi:MAG: hypothetical protein PHP13_02415 [Methanomicrobium sp.]|nr:hypothetical protein [Methanomicrobium sp.]
MKNSSFFLSAMSAAFFILITMSAGCASGPYDPLATEKSNDSYDNLMPESVSALQGDTFAGLEGLFKAAEECAAYQGINEYYETGYKIFSQNESGIITGTKKSSGLKLKLKEAASENECILTVAYIGKDCNVLEVYPESEGFFRGVSLSGQESVIVMNQKRVPMLTSLFELKQGGYGAAVYYPVFLGDCYEGFISIAFKPETFFGNLAKEIKENSDLEVMVLQKDGLILYDPDETETGKPTFNNTEYEKFPEIQQAAKKIVNEWSGNTNYSYYSTGTQSVVKKRQFWTTVSYGENEWKLTVIRDIS